VIVYSALSIATVPVCVTGVQRRRLTLWQLVVTVTLLLWFCFILIASVAAVGTAILLLLWTAAV